MRIRLNPCSIIWVLIVLVSSASLAAAAPSALEKARERGTIVACADPYNMPFSSPDPNTPGFDVDIAREIATGMGLDIAYHWADTGTRGGLSRAIRLSINDGKCAFFMGVPDEPDMIEEYEEKRLVITRPYVNMGYVLVGRTGGRSAKTLAEVKDAKIGVIMFTVADMDLSREGFKTDPYRISEENLAALQNGDVEFSLLLSSKVGWWLHQNPDSGLEIVDGFTPDPRMDYGLVIAVRRTEQDLKAAINEQLEKLVASGRIAEIVAKYGVPFLPPSN
ncbi:MAG: transporter substrate-binding domain-containing protein [Candidatus Tectomicrobia bacterium]|nr:transporter substrate-binding domain-containing protein [Candidatus Tectomicrobia bacterium]